MANLKEIISAFEVEKVSETYNKPIEIIDLQDELGTRGHVLVIRGDKALAEELEGQKGYQTQNSGCMKIYWILKG